MAIELSGEELYIMESKLAEAEEKLEMALNMLETVITTGNNLDYKLLCQRFIECNRPKETPFYTIDELTGNPEDLLF